jgi:sec-independent protein translocase protein TatC
MARSNRALSPIVTVAKAPVEVARLPVRTVRGVKRALTEPLPDEPDVYEEMTLSEHLLELRSRVFRACVAIGVAFIIGIVLANPTLHLIARTSQVEKFDVNDVTENITDFFKVALYLALVIAFPVIFYQAFAFIAPGLSRKEKRIVYTSIPFVVILFLMGASFAFFLAIPRAFRFLSGFNSDIVDFSPTFSSVAAFYIQVSVGMGLAFELPIVMYLLARLGIVSPKRMSASRRYAAVAILIAAALITPTPDPFNMMVVAIPIYIIFELGLIFARVGARRHDAADQLAATRFDV